MRAISMARYGGPEVLSLRTVGAPVPGPGEVRIEVCRAGVNPADMKLRAGLLKELRPLEFPSVPGSEIAGTVESVGVDVSGLEVGDEVFGWSRSGAYAELATARIVVRKPAGVSWDAAAALPVAGEAALRSLRLLAVAAGEVLVIHGAAGSVGTIAVQLALQRGARVIATARTDDHLALRDLGAIPVAFGRGVEERIRYAAEGRVDAVLDAAGAGVLEGSTALRGGVDRIVTLADPAAFGMGIMFSAGTQEDLTTDVLDELASQFEAGRLRLPPARRFPLEQAVEAQIAGETGGRRGKIMLEV